MHWLIACTELFFGTLDYAQAHPREVAKQTLLRDAGALARA